jgi:hypothetical protein
MNRLAFSSECDKKYTDGERRIARGLLKWFLIYFIVRLFRHDPLLLQSAWAGGARLKLLIVLLMLAMVISPMLLSAAFDRAPAEEPNLA